MPRRKPITKLGVFGKYDQNPEQAVENYFESKLNNKCYINVPGWDVARNGFELKGIHNDREYMEITKEQHRMREQAQRQVVTNRKRLEQTTDLLQRMRAEFVELNDFLKDCEMKEQGALDTVFKHPGEPEKEKHVQYEEKIAQLESDLEQLDEFVVKYEETINQFEPFEKVMEQTIAESKTYETMQDLIQRCDSLLLAQVEISAVEQQKIQEIEEIRQNLFKATKTALHIITGLNNDLSELLTQYVAAKEEGLRWEKSVTVVKSYMVENESSINCLLDAINHVYILLRKRRGSQPKAPRGDVETQLDHIKEEIEILHEVRRLAAAKLRNEGHSLCAEKGTQRRKTAL
ncbi:uncharacterized protein LOC120894104 [Anopheles arabiensis]|uniref:uncharacterized protein LOC120894104 n=1 Tax=Anopheles arabiensis TaxID=7173 RepID=UPI001AADAA60|nr:uncharacterized protein LOC120894104 [Anopheles arabiensis]